jgi:alanine racemase
MPVNPCLLTIDLQAIRANYNYLKSLSSADVGAAVKANAYGLGSREVVGTLYAEGCSEFFVAHLEEAIELRSSFAEPNIYVLGGLFEGEEREFLHYNIIPVLSTGHQAELWQKYAQKLNKKLPCIVHADSGMHRFGMTEAELQMTSTCAELDVLYLMSHLACADQADHEHNQYQLAKFKSHHHIFPKAKYSFANSSGVFLGSEFHFDLLRPGMALYGLNPTPGKPNPMKNPVILTSQIMQIRQMADDGFVGYGAAHKAHRNSKIATIPIGYADGFLRNLSHHGFVYIEGKRVPIIGRVSMDLVTLDVSDLDCKVGDRVEIIGANSHPDDIAKRAGTIGHEILTSLGSRYTRIYLDDKEK